MKKTSSKPPFGYLVSRTFGSPFSGYRGDYTVYPDENWRHSLRKYPYNGRPSTPKRRARSASPRRKVANTKNIARKQALQQVLAKIDSTQEDLEGLARKVAIWSKEAASLSEGLREEALLLELSRQADRLAASEAQFQELQKQERVYRLSRENSVLRNELRDMIRVCRLLLENRTQDALLSERPGRHRSRHGSRRRVHRSTTPAPEPDRVRPAPPGTQSAAVTRSAGGAWYPAEADSSHQVTLEPHRGISAKTPPYVPAPPPPAGSERAGARAANATYDRMAAGNETFYFDSTGARRPRDALVVRDAGLEGLTEDNALVIVAADSAEADADADPRVRAPQLMSPADYAARSDYVREVASQAARFRREVALDKQQMAVDAPVVELTFNFTPSGRDTAPAAAGTSRALDTSTTRPSFAGFHPAEDARTVQATPTLPDAWRRHQHQHQKQQLQQQQLREEEQQQRQLREEEQQQRQLLRQLRDEQREAVLAVAKAEAAAEAAAVVEAKAATQALEEEALQSDKELPHGAKKGTPVKLVDGLSESDPLTPSYSGVSEENSYGGAYPYIPPVGVLRRVPDDAPPTVRRRPPAPADVRHGATGTAGYDTHGDGGAGPSMVPPPPPPPAAGQARPYPLDSVLLTEVEKLKSINRTLAATLQSYNLVTSRLSGSFEDLPGLAAGAPAAAAAAASAASASAAQPAAMRALFRQNGDLDVTLLSESAAATYAPSYASGAPQSSRYPPMYTGGPLATRVTAAGAAPAPPTPQLQRHAPQPLQRSEQRTEAAAKERLIAEADAQTEERRWALSRSLGPGRGRSGGGGGGDVLSEVRRLDSALDDQLYGIRQQLQALRHEMVEDRLTALAVTAGGGHGGSGVAASAVSPAAAAEELPLAVMDRRQLAYIQDEIASLRRQVQYDRQWNADKGR